MKIAVIGSRTITNADITPYLPTDIDGAVSGGARGVDTLAESWARENNIHIEVIKPDYDALGNKAPLARDRIIVDRADEVYAFWDGVSTGTMFTVGYARREGKTVHLFKCNGAGFEEIR